MNVFAISILKIAGKPTALFAFNLSLTQSYENFVFTE